MDGYLTWVAAGLEQRFVLAASVEKGRDQHCRLLLTALMLHNVSGIAEGGDYLHNSPSEAQMLNSIGIVALAANGLHLPEGGDFNH